MHRSREWDSFGTCCLKWALMELLPTLKSGAFNNSTHLLFFGFWGRDECQRDTDAAADFPPLCRLLQPQLVGIG